MRVERRVGAGALVALGLSTSALAESGTGTLAMDQVRVLPSGEHRVWVTALDPGERLEELTVTEARVDGRPAEGIEVRSWDRLHRRFRLALVVDGSLTLEDRDALAATVDRIAGGLTSSDRLRIAIAGETATPHSFEISGGSGDPRARLRENLPEAPAPSRLWDALLSEARAASRRPPATGGAILLVTRGSDHGSVATPLQILALLEDQERRLPIFVVMIENRSSADAERLGRLAHRAGGALRKIPAATGLATAVGELLPRARNSQRVRFHVPGWDRGLDSHRLEIRVTAGGASRLLTHEYGAEVLLPPWWGRPAPWIWLGALGLSAMVLAASLAVGRRRLLTLRMESGEEEGCWYEVFALPLTLGAAPGNHLVLGEPDVSRNHALLQRRGNGIEIVDLNSENGTFVNEEPVLRRVLVDGDRIRLGARVELGYSSGAR